MALVCTTLPMSLSSGEELLWSWAPAAHQAPFPSIPGCFQFTGLVSAPKWGFTKPGRWGRYKHTVSGHPTM